MRSSITLNARADFANDNPAVVQALIGVFSDLARLVREEPEKVIAALRYLYPTIDQETFDLVVATELDSFDTPPCALRTWRPPLPSPVSAGKPAGRGHAGSRRDAVGHPRSALGGHNPDSKGGGEIRPFFDASPLPRLGLFARPDGRQGIARHPPCPR